MVGVSIRQAAHPVLLGRSQAVHELYEIVDGPPLPTEGPVESKVVFIGRHLDRTTLETSLRECLM